MASALERDPDTGLFPDPVIDPDADASEITLDADGNYSFSFSTAGESGNLSIIVEATDMNGRSTVQSVSLLGNANGPHLEITAPFNNSYYSSEATVVGLVRNLGSSAAIPDTSEVERVYYIIGASTVENEVTDWEDNASTFSYTFDTTELSDSIIVRTVAVDKNGRQTSSSITLIPYLGGPFIDVTTPAPSSSYISTVNVVGTVTDRDPEGTATSELYSLSWEVPNPFMSDIIERDPDDGTFPATSGITLDEDNGSFSFSFSTANL